MGQREILVQIIHVLNHHRIEYLLTGSLAVSYYGFPRATHDIDFVIETTPNQLGKVKLAISDLGPDYIGEALDSSFFNLYHAETGIKIDLWLVSPDEFTTKFKRKQTMRVGRQTINLISPEDLILTKLRWCKEAKSERHMRDCAGILEVQKGKLDMTHLRKMAKEFEVESLFREAGDYPV
ncbi:MAG: nucleotidyltransferase [Candidatus Curtissbacteria bacterium]|nr:nucleotidyltransferase [Candidatus Curtissbacteria bacterium]